MKIFAVSLVVFPALISSKVTGLKPRSSAE
jgi:hypothetical protein